MKKKSRKPVIRWTIGSLLIILLCVLCYYQFLYKAKRVNSNIYTLAHVYDKHRHIVNAVKFSPDGNMVASGSVDSTVQIWEAQSGQLRNTLRQPGGITYLDYSLDGKYVATTGYDGKVRLWLIESGKLARTFDAGAKTPWSVAFSPDSRTLATGSEDATVKLWDIQSGQLLHTLAGHELTIWSLQFTPDGLQLVSGSYDKTLKFWSVSDGKLLRSIHAHEQAIVALAISHDGKLVASGADDSKIKIWTVAEGQLLRTITASEEHVQALAFSPDDQWLIAGGRDKPMIGELLQEIFGDAKINKGVTMRLFEVNTGRLLLTFDHHGNDATDMDFSPDGQWIVLGSADHTVSTWKRNRK